MENGRTLWFEYHFKAKIKQLFAVKHLKPSYSYVSKQPLQSRESKEEIML